MRDKRGQGLPTSTIVLIAIGVVILVIFVIGLYIGFDRILPFIKPSSNVKEVADQCALACTTDARYDYCSAPRELRTEEKIKFSGEEFSEELQATCNELSLIDPLGMQKCSDISCSIESPFTDEKFAKLYCKDVADKTTKVTYADVEEPVACEILLQA